MTLHFVALKQPLSAPQLVLCCSLDMLCQLFVGILKINVFMCSTLDSDELGYPSDLIFSKYCYSKARSMSVVDLHYTDVADTLHCCIIIHEHARDLKLVGAIQAQLECEATAYLCCYIL